MSKGIKNNAKTKADLANQLKGLRGTFLAGIAGCYALSDPRVIPLIQTDGFEWVVERLSDQNSRKHIVLELEKFLLRAMLKEPFELIKAYCASSSQSDLLKSQPWYQFARILRNNVSHNMRFDFSLSDVSKVLPTTWNGKILDATMQGQELTFSFMSPKDVTHLVMDMEEFVKTSLK